MHFCTVPVVMCRGKGRLSILFAFDLSTVMLPCSCINCEI